MGIVSVGFCVTVYICLSVGRVIVAVHGLLVDREVLESKVINGIFLCKLFYLFFYL